MSPSLPAPGPPMRILHVAESFGGGVLEVIRWLAERHVRSGHAVAVAYGIRPETPADVAAELPADVELLPLPWEDRSLRSQLRTLRALPDVVRRVRPDIVHLHSSYASVAGALVLPRHLPRVTSPHAYSFTMASAGRLRRAAFTALEGHAARRASLVGAVSQSEADTARRVLRAPRVDVVANGIPELDDPTSRPDRPPLPARVVAMGRAEPQRRPEACAQILDAVRDLAEVEWVGDASTTAAGLAALTEARIPVTGWIPREEATARLSRAGVYLHFTAWDGQPLSVLEAMARDVAVVASDIPPNREILGEGSVFTTPEEAIAAIRRLLTDEAHAGSVIEDQRRRRSHYGADRMAAQWLAVYRRVIAAGHGARA